MSDNARKLLERLQQNARPMTGGQLAQLLGVSNRTIINYVKELNSGRDKPLIQSSFEGYTLDREEMARDRQRSESVNAKEDIPQTYKERSFYIISRFLLENAVSLDIYDLCEELCISYSLLKNDIQKMNVSYAYLHVRFYGRSNRLYIEGKEKDKRRLMNHVLQERQQNDFMGAGALGQYFPKEDVDCLLELLNTVCQEEGFYLNDFARSNLMIHLLIMVSRLRAGDRLTEGDAGAIQLTPSMQKDPDYQLALRIQSLIEKRLNVNIGYEDYLQIAFLVKSNSTFLAIGTMEALEDYLDADFLFQIRQIMRQVEQRYLIALDQEQFLATFTLHLKNMMLRNRNKNQIQNPLKDDLRQASPILYDIALSILEEMRYRNMLPEPVSEDEVSFIVLHLYSEVQRQYQTESSVNGLLILPNYLQMAEQIAQKILSRYGGELILTTASAMEDVPENQEYELVITTQRTFSGNGEELIYISPLLSHHDFQRIGEALERVGRRRQLNYLKENFPYYFDECNFVTGLQAPDTKESVIRMLSRRLKENDCVDSAFFDSVMSREAAISTGYRGFAIPHAVDLYARQNTIAVYLSQEGIPWGKHTVYVVFLMAISPDTLIDFQTLYQTLSELLLETNIIQTLKSCKSFTEFQDTMLDPQYLTSVH